MNKKKRYFLYGFILVCFILAFTSPSSNEYDLYLNKVHGIDCDSNLSRNCKHTKNDLFSSKITHSLFFMTAETNIYGDKYNNIRVIGILNNFFIVENNLELKNQ